MQDSFNQHLQDKKGLANTVLHLDKFITPKAITLFYWVLMIVIALVCVLGFLGGIIALLTGNISHGLTLIIASPLGALVYWFILRMSVEMTILAFKSNEYLKKISEK